MQTATDVLTLYDRAVPVAQRIVEGIRPEQLTAPTPCTDWNVRAVLDHTVGLLRSAAEAASASPDGADADDPASAFAAAARAAGGAAFRTPGALERSFPMPWGETTAKRWRRSSSWTSSSIAGIWPRPPASPPPSTPTSARPPSRSDAR